MIDQESMELQEIYNDGADATEIFHFQVCLVYISSVYARSVGYCIPGINRKLGYLIYLHRVLYLDTSFRNIFIVASAILQCAAE